MGRDWPRPGVQTDLEYYQRCTQSAQAWWIMVFLRWVHPCPYLLPFFHALFMEHEDGGKKMSSSYGKGKCLIFHCNTDTTFLPFFTRSSQPHHLKKQKQLCMGCNLLRELGVLVCSFFTCSFPLKSLLYTQYGLYQLYRREQNRIKLHNEAESPMESTTSPYQHHHNNINDQTPPYRDDPEL